MYQAGTLPASLRDTQYVVILPEAKKGTRRNGGVGIAGLELRGMTASMFWLRGSNMVSIFKASLRVFPELFIERLIQAETPFSPTGFSKIKNENGKRDDESSGLQGPT